MGFKTTFKRLAPSPLLSVARGATNVVRSGKSRVLAVADTYGLVSPDRIYSESWYQEMAENPQLRADASSVVSALNEAFSPDSVIDLGCGVGLYLAAFEERGTFIKGVDGASVVLEHALVDPAHIEIHDLREPYAPGLTYDLVVCFEVAEHLPSRYADTLVESIARCGDVVVFTAATPDQGGTHHVNERPREYWKEKFETVGLSYDPGTTGRLREKIDVVNADWIPENLFVFRKKMNV